MTRQEREHTARGHQMTDQRLRVQQLTIRPLNTLHEPIIAVQGIFPRGRADYSAPSLALITDELHAQPHVLLPQLVQRGLQIVLNWKSLRNDCGQLTRHRQPERKGATVLRRQQTVAAVAAALSSW